MANLPSTGEGVTIISARPSCSIIMSLFKEKKGCLKKGTLLFDRACSRDDIVGVDDGSTGDVVVTGVNGRYPAVAVHVVDTTQMNSIEKRITIPRQFGFQRLNHQSIEGWDDDMWNDKPRHLHVLLVRQKD